MTDHELCLLSALAAGYTVEVKKGNRIIRTYPDGLTEPWDPLSYNVDTFDLIVDCEVGVRVYANAVVADCHGVYAEELVGDADRHVAVRRAVTRAVATAAMGDRMP